MFLLSCVIRFITGQRDKPFVPEEENELRTPRPDLLDRPYAPDYAGESFRNQYKNDPPYQNTLSQSDSKKQTDRKSYQSNDVPHKYNTHYSVPGHWRISNQPNSVTTEVPFASPTPLVPRHTQDESQRVKSPRRRHDEFVDNRNDFLQTDSGAIDLGVSSSQDSRRSQSESHFENSLTYSNAKQQYSTSTTTTTPIPFAASSTMAPTRSTVVQSVLSTILQPPKTDGPRLSTTTELNFKPSTFPADLSISPSITPLSFVRRPTGGPKLNVEIIHQSVGESSTVKPAHIKRPIADLLPPYETLRLYDDSTTQGPSIYYEWKMPSSAGSELQDLLDSQSGRRNESVPVPVNFLQPPKFTNETHRKPSLPVSELQPPFEHAFHNPSINSTTLITSPSIKSHQTLNKFPTPRSIDGSESAQRKFLARKKSSKAVDNNYLDLKKLLLIPDYTFPLEVDDGRRPSYQENDAVNSFQIKIPVGQKTRGKAWYGENADCPECHPSFLKPGSCEPCIKFR